MIKIKRIKKNLLILLIGLMISSLSAQQKKMPFQITPEFGIPFMSLTNDIYKGKSLNTGQQYGFGAKYGVSKHFALGLEGQYRTFSIEPNIEEAYRPMFQFDPDRKGTYNSSNILNGILSFNYYRYNKNETNLFQVGLGGGIQQLKQGENTLLFHSPVVPNDLVSVYKDGGTHTAPIAQLSIENTFFINKSIGIHLSIKVQYAPNQYEVTYKPLPTDANSQEIYFIFMESEPVTETVKTPAISFIPSIGITLPFGTRDKEPRWKSCFLLDWINQPAGSECFTDEKLDFEISGPNTALRYEVYLASYADLNHPVLLLTLPTATVFSISASQLDADKVYDVIVKSIYQNSDRNCLRHIGSIKRCADACKDSKLPE